MPSSRSAAVVRADHSIARTPPLPNGPGPAAARVPRATARQTLALVVGCIIGTAGAADAQLQSREEALAAAYPGAEIRAEQVFLTAEQQERVAGLAGVNVTTALVARYVAIRDARIVGRAYVDTHIVRTKRESLLISLEADGRVKRIDVTAFQEPMEYLPPAPWLAQHEGRLLSEDLRMHRIIRPIAGATLSATAVTDSTRRVLAIDQTLESAVPTPKAPR